MSVIILLSSELAWAGTTPDQFLRHTSVGEQQRIAAQIMFARGRPQIAQRLLSHDPSLTQFVVQSDG